MRVGQKVFVKKCCDNAGHCKNNNLYDPIEERTVTRVGREYFRIDGYFSDDDFHIDTGRAKTECSVGYIAHQSMLHNIQITKSNQ